jgi:hypothetical protein
MSSKFDSTIQAILKEQFKSPLVNTMGNPGYGGTAGLPDMGKFTGATGGGSSDPSGQSDPGSTGNTATSQFAAQAMGAGNNLEQLANQFMGTAIGDIEKIVNMRDASTAAQKERSVYSQLDPTGAEAMAKSIEQPNFNWDEFKTVLRNKVSQLGNVAGSLVGQST